MALTELAVWFDLHQLLGGDFDTRRTKAYVTTNVENGTLIDTETGEIRLGDQKVELNDDGTGEFLTWRPTPGTSNPASWQTSLVVDYPRTGHNDRTRRTFGPYTIDALTRTVTNKALTSNVATITLDEPHGLRVGDAFTISAVDATFNGNYDVLSVPSPTTLTYAKTAANVASVAATGTFVTPYVSLALLEDEQAIPPNYQTAFTADMEAIRDEAIAAGLNWRGAWSAATAYAVADAVSYGGSSYRRLIAGTTATNPAADPTRWGLLASKGDQGPPGPGTGAGAWQASTAYVANQVVQAPDGSMISRNANGTSRATFDATEQAAWTVVLNKTGTMEQTALSATYGRPLSSTLTDATFDTLLASLAPGAHVFVPPDVTVTLNAAHTLTQPVHIHGPGRILDARTNPASPLFTLGPAASGTEITCHLAGSVSGQYKSNHHAIRVLGTDNGAGVAPTFVTDLVLKPASISGFGSVGISAEFIKDYLFDVDVIHDMGYSGILMSSAIDGAAIVHRIADLTPGTAGNVYGIHWSRRDQTDDLVRYPRSENFFGWIGEMHGAPLWDGIGVHGARSGTIGWGSMRNVKKPFDVTAATGSDGEQLYAPHDIHIIPGSANSGVTDGTLGPAGIVNGAYRTDASPGTVVEYATGIKLAAGTYRGYGVESSASAGAMIFYATKGLEADVGVMVEPAPYAVNVYHDNLDFKLTVTAIDPWSNTAGVGEASVVRVASTYNKGVITFAGGSRGSKTATYVYTRGISVLNDATNDIRLMASNLEAATTPISGPVVARLEVWLKLLLGIRLPDGTAASPSATFENDRDTGFYSSGADQLAVAVGGIRRARWLATALSLDYGISVVTDNTYDLAGTSNKFRSIYAGTSTVVGTAQRRNGAGSPEGVVSAPIGSIYTRTDGGAGTTLYVKESGTGNTGWVAK